MKTIYIVFNWDLFYALFATHDGLCSGKATVLSGEYHA